MRTPMPLARATISLCSFAPCSSLSAKPSDTTIAALIPLSAHSFKICMTVRALTMTIARSGGSGMSRSEA